jgi:hypothetical protein
MDSKKSFKKIALVPFHKLGNMLSFPVSGAKPNLGSIASTPPPPIYNNETYQQQPAAAANSSQDLKTMLLRIINDVNMTEDEQLSSILTTIRQFLFFKNKSQFTKQQDLAAAAAAAEAVPVRVVKDEPSETGLDDYEEDVDDNVNQPSGKHVPNVTIAQMLQQRKKKKGKNGGDINLAVQGKRTQSFVLGHRQKQATKRRRLSSSSPSSSTFSKQRRTTGIATDRAAKKRKTIDDKDGKEDNESFNFPAASSSGGSLAQRLAQGAKNIIQNWTNV